MPVSLAVPILLLLCSLHSVVETRGLPEDTQIPEDITDPTVLEIIDHRLFRVVSLFILKMSYDFEMV